MLRLGVCDLSLFFLYVMFCFSMCSNGIYMCVCVCCVIRAQNCENSCGVEWHSKKLDLFSPGIITDLFLSQAGSYKLSQNKL